MQAISSTSSELETAEVVTKLLSKHLEKRETYNTNEYNYVNKTGGRHTHRYKHGKKDEVEQ